MVAIAETMNQRKNAVAWLLADCFHGGDDDDGDQSGDETIFDSRDAGLTFDKATEQITHD
jgi:hypothetical protein